MKSGFGREVEYELDDDAEFRLNGNECTYKTIKMCIRDRYLYCGIKSIVKGGSL